MVTRFGYHGKVLHLDLATRRSWIEEPGDRFWRIYGGGGLLATHYLLRECPARIDPLDPANLLILTSSVVAGHPYAGLARYTASAKSPLTGGIGETRCEGPFGIALKGSGVDSLVFHGAADRPTTVVVEDGRVDFCDAGDLWGRSVSETVDMLETRFGSGIHTAVIGPAGERLVRFASIVSERSYQAARMGMGAVMGAKRLKAIAIRGVHHPPVADPATCAEITQRYQARMRDNALTRWQLDPPGFSAWVHLHGLDAALCTRNYRDSVFEGADCYDAKYFMHYYRHDGNCPGCPNNCIKYFGTDDDTTYDPRAGGIHQEIRARQNIMHNFFTLCQIVVYSGHLYAGCTAFGKCFPEVYITVASGGLYCVHADRAYAQHSGMDRRTVLITHTGWWIGSLQYLETRFQTVPGYRSQIFDQATAGGQQSHDILQDLVLVACPFQKWPVFFHL